MCFCFLATRINEEVTIQEVMEYGYLELKYIIEWAKKVPGMHTFKFFDDTTCTVFILMTDTTCTVFILMKLCYYRVNLFV